MDHQRSSRNSLSTCDLCNSAGDRVDAVGFCTTCDEHLCMTCFTCHIRGKATKDHAVINVINEPKIQKKQQPPGSADITAISGTEYGNYFWYYTKGKTEQVEKSDCSKKKLHRYSCEREDKEVTKQCKSCGKFLCYCSEEEVIGESQECDLIREEEDRYGGHCDNDVMSMNGSTISDSTC